MTEEWRDVVGYEGMYQVSSFGRVYSIARRCGYRSAVNGRFLKPSSRKGYLCYGLCKGGRKTEHCAHRLVAIAFIDNPENKPQINHIDNNPSNNNVKNLEWCTVYENSLHSQRQDRQVHKAVPIIATNTITGEKYYFPSQYQAAKHCKAIQSIVGRLANRAGNKKYWREWKFELGGEAI